MGQQLMQIYLSKNDSGAFGVIKQMKYGHLEPIVSHFGRSKVTICVASGLIWDYKCIKNGSKMCFPNDNLRPFGGHKQVK